MEPSDFRQLAAEILQGVRNSDDPAYVQRERQAAREILARGREVMMHDYVAKVGRHNVTIAGFREHVRQHYDEQAGTTQAR